MIMPLKEGMSLVNIVRAEVIEDGVGGKTYAFDTASESNIEPFISDGEETILRVKNKIKAINRTEDIVAGYDITFSDNVLIPEVMALVDGGTVTFDTATPPKATKYEGPAAGQVVTRKTFTINIYTEEKDVDGATVKYAKLSFNNCKGTPVSFSLKDGEFFVPEFKVKSRPKNGEKPITIEFLSTLPVA